MYLSAKSLNFGFLWDFVPSIRRDLIEICIMIWFLQLYVFVSKESPIHEPNRSRCQQIIKLDMHSCTSFMFIAPGPEPFDFRWNGFFNWTMTYRTDSDILYSYGWLSEAGNSSLSGVSSVSGLTVLVSILSIPVSAESVPVLVLPVPVLVLPVPVPLQPLEMSVYLLIVRSLGFPWEED